MKILAVHNHYREPGGEDAVFRGEVALLSLDGHEVEVLTEDNRRLEAAGAVRAAAGLFWSWDAYRAVGRKLAEGGFDVVHVQNTFARLSASVLYASRRSRTPVVQTLHNYRLVCAGALLLRDLRPCEACLGRWLPLPAVRHACYRGSRAESAVVAASNSLHALSGTWRREVDAFVAPSEFARRKLVEGGLPGGRIHVVPNFVHPDPGPRSSGGSSVLFAGRLAEEKGIRVLLDAWRLLTPAPLVVAGDGPLGPELRGSGGLERVAFLGRVPPERVMELLAEAALLVVPSLCYECFPVAVAEAFARGVPVVASRHGALAELVEEGQTGWLFEPGDPRDLAAAVGRALADPEALARAGREARRVYEARYSSDRHLEGLLEVYSRAIARRRGRP